MKKNIHPNWNHQGKVNCSCGEEFITGLTTSELHVEICSKCHPFFTGEMKLVDVQGRIDKFRSRMAAAKTKPHKKSKPKTDKDSKEHKSLKELLQEEKQKLAAA